MAACNRDCFNCIYDDCIEGELIPKKDGWYARLSEEKKAVISEQIRRKRQEARAKGLCNRCLKRPVVDGLAVCQECRIKENERARKYYRLRWGK